MTWTTTETFTAEEIDRAAMEQAVDERAGSLEAVVEHTSPGFLQRFRSQVAPYVLGAGAFLTSLGVGVSAQADAPKDAELFRYIVPVAASASGANNSQWETRLLGSNPGEELANVYVTVHPRGLPASDADPRTPDPWVTPPGSFDWQDPLKAMGISGVAWLEIESDQPLMFDDSVTGNVSADGSYQSSLIPTFTETNIPLDQRFTRGGDVLEVRLSSPSSVRANKITYVPEISGAVRQVDEILDELRNVVATAYTDIQPGTFLQHSPITQLFPGLALNTGDTWRSTTIPLSEADVYVYQTLSDVDNVVSTSQDPANRTGSITRALEGASVNISSGEVNDPTVYAVHVRAGDAAEISSVYVDWTGQGQGGNAYEVNGSSFDLEAITTHRTAGEYTPTLRVNLNTTKGQVSRDFTGNDYTVVEEQNFTDIPDSYNITKNNIDTLADLLGNNINVVYRGDNTHYGEEDMRSFLEMYTNGSTADAELDHVQLMDQNNDIIYSMTTGGNAVWGGLTEQQVDRLKMIYLDE